MLLENLDLFYGDGFYRTGVSGIDPSEEAEKSNNPEGVSNEYHNHENHLNEEVEEINSSVGELMARNCPSRTSSRLKERQLVNGINDTDDKMEGVVNDND